MKVSLPAPPLRLSIPGPPLITSAPYPPEIVSTLEPPVIISAPRPPVIVILESVSNAPSNVRAPVPTMPEASTSPATVYRTPLIVSVTNVSLLIARLAVRAPEPVNVIFSIRDIPLVLATAVILAAVRVTATVSVPPPPARISPVAKPAAFVVSNLKISSPLPPVNVSTTLAPLDRTSNELAADNVEPLTVIAPAAVELSMIRLVWPLFVKKMSSTVRVKRPSS